MEPYTALQQQLFTMQDLKYRDFHSRLLPGIDKETIETFIILLAPFAPHITEELWEQYGHTTSVFENQWPEHDEEAMKDDEIEIPVQINGKTRAVISVSASISKEDAIVAGKEAIADKLTGNIIKEIYVPGKIINIVQK